MKRVLQICLVFVLVLSLIGCVSAYTTKIHVKTPINKEVQLSIVNNGAVIESWRNNSDIYGDFIREFTSSLSQFDVIVYLKQGGENLMLPEKLVGAKAGEDIYIEMIPSGFEKVETPNETEVEEVENDTGVVDNSTEVNETEIVNETEEVESSEGSFISGHSIADLNLDNKYVYYSFICIGCLAFVLFAGFMVARIKRKSTTKKKKEDEDIDKKEIEKELHSENNVGEIKVKKLSELQKEMAEKKSNSEGDGAIADKIDELQKKIDDLQKALNNGDNKKKE